MTKEETEEKTKEIKDPKQQYEIEICFSCGKNAIGLDECECGSTQIIYGNGFKKTKDDLFCDCGNNQLRLIGHINMAKFHYYTYSCTKCGNKIGKQSKKNKDDYDYEDDDNE